MKLKGIDGGPHKRRNMWFNSMIREEPYPGLKCRRPTRKLVFQQWRLCRCCHGCRQLVPWGVGLSAITSATLLIVTNRLSWGLYWDCHRKCEEGRDDVKSARPYVRGDTRVYNGGYRGLPTWWQDANLLKASLSSDRSLQLDFVKLDSLVIAHQPWRGEYVPGLVHTAVKPWKLGGPEVRNRKERPRVKLVTGAKS